MSVNGVEMDVFVFGGKPDEILARTCGWDR